METAWTLISWLPVDLVNRLVMFAQEKSVVRLTDRFDMTKPKSKTCQVVSYAYMFVV